MENGTPGVGGFDARTDVFKPEWELMERAFRYAESMYLIYAAKRLIEEPVEEARRAAVQATVNAFEVMASSWGFVRARSHESEEWKRRPAWEQMQEEYELTPDEARKRYFLELTQDIWNTYAESALSHLVDMEGAQGNERKWILALFEEFKNPTFEPLKLEGTQGAINIESREPAHADKPESNKSLQDALQRAVRSLHSLHERDRTLSDKLIKALDEVHRLEVHRLQVSKEPTDSESQQGTTDDQVESQQGTTDDQVLAFHQMRAAKAEADARQALRKLDEGGEIRYGWAMERSRGEVVDALLSAKEDSWGPMEEVPDAESVAESLVNTAMSRLRFLVYAEKLPGASLVFSKTERKVTMWDNLGEWIYQWVVHRESFADDFYKAGRSATKIESSDDVKVRVDDVMNGVEMLMELRDEMLDFLDRNQDKKDIHATHVIHASQLITHFCAKIAANLENQQSVRDSFSRLWYFREIFAVPK